MAYNSQDTHGQFLDRAGRAALLTADQEIILARRVQKMVALKDSNPDGPYSREDRTIIRVGTRAKQRMIEANLRLVIYICRRCRIYSYATLTMDDIIQEGAIGLARAVEKFDPERGYKFSTYAYRWVTQALRRAYSQKEHMIRPPAHLAELVVMRNKRTQEFIEEHGRLPTRDELATALKTRRDELDLIDQRLSAYTSLDKPQPGTDGDTNLGDCLTAEWHDDDDSYPIDAEKLRLALSRLDDKTREMITLRYGLHSQGKAWTNSEIGAKFGCSREYARTVILRGVNKIKLFVNTTPPAPRADEPIPQWLPEAQTTRHPAGVFF